MATATEENESVENEEKPDTNETSGLMEEAAQEKQQIQEAEQEFKEENKETEEQNEENVDKSENEEEKTYVPVGELSEEQVDSLADHMVDEDGNVDVNELYKSQQGLRETLAEDDTDEDDSDGEKSEEDNIPDSKDDYVIEYEEDGETKELDGDMGDIVKEAGLESGLTEEQLNNFLKEFDGNFTEQFTRNVDVDEELKKLSDDPEQAKQMVHEVHQRIEGYKERGFLTDKEYQEAVYMGGTAEGLSVLRKFMARGEDFNEIPEDNSSVGGDSVDDINSQINELMDHEAYSDPSHKEHQRIVEEADKLRKKRRNLKKQT